MKLTPEFESDIRARVNPAYVDVIGTESYERAALLGEIDALRKQLSAARTIIKSLEERYRRIYQKDMDRLEAIRTLDSERQMNEILTNEIDLLRKALDPRQWTKEMHDAWHQNIPDTIKAFEALRGSN